MKLKLLFISFLIAGCHQKSAPDTGSPTTVATTPAADAPALASGQASANPPKASTKPLPAPPPAVAGRADNYLRENVAGDPDPFLTGQLRTFIEQKHRMPESFAEFATSRLDSIPRPPEGKKWVIDIAALQVKASPAK